MRTFLRVDLPLVKLPPSLPRVGLVGALVLATSAVGVGLLPTGRLAAELATALLAGALVFSLDRQRRFKSALLRLASHGAAGATTGQIIQAIGNRLAGSEHRALERNPTSNLPTREQLLAVMAAEVGRGGSRLLGLVHFEQYDQLMAFDAPTAQGALADIAERLAQAAGRRHFVSHVDRATLAIWFRSEAARSELAAMLFVARQPVRVGERTLTPSILSCAVEPDPAKASAAEQILAEAVAGLSRRVLVAPMGSSALIKRGEEQFVLEQGLARAIEEGQLSMVFQPLVNANLGRVIGAEALLRWVHPELGPVSPARFIPLVEELGLIDRYGLWVLNAACREAARWRALGLAELRMAVNLSARQVSDPQLEIKIERTAARHGVALGTLELELTETAVMADASRTLDLFTRLRARGVGLAIDDFGAGYSSLSYLKNLPFTKLKIDREFVSNIDTEPSGRAICKALLELGRGLGLVVLAEGVETAEELAVLRRLGCDVFQGFHFSKPLSGDDFLRFIPTFERGDPLPGVQLDEFSA